MPGLLEGKSIVITGSGRGIGREVAILAASLGARVVVNDPGVNMDGTSHDNGPAEQTVNDIKAKGGTAVANFDAVGTMDSGEALIKTALDNFGRLDGLVNCAGILRDRMVFNMAEEEWDDVIRVHLKGHFSTIKPASILFRQQRYGRIVNFTSISGLQGNPGQANYGAAKAGIAGLTRVVAREMGRYGVTCNAISPGAQTRMVQSIPDTARQLRARAAGQSGQDAVAASQPPPELSPRGPEQVAPMTVFLLTDDAWNINGQIFHVAGGMIQRLAHPYPPVAGLFKPGGAWTMDELSQLVPAQLMTGVVNPAPPPADLDLPGHPAAAAEQPASG
jgi:NAD(P)-dependent dehydrogenase (short-subunit alcohol dehydrogenase family)